MNYQKAKDIVVNDGGWVSSKVFRKTLIRYILLMLGVLMMVGYLVYNMFGLGLFLLSAILVIFMFSSILEIATISKSSFLKFKRVMLFWWLIYILFIAVWFILKFFNIY